MVFLNGSPESMRYHKNQFREFQMRFHIFRESVWRNLLIADFQAKYLDFANFNILSLPVAKNPDTYNFIPRAGRIHIIVIFIDRNYLFSNLIPSEVSAEEVANKINNLANVLKYRLEKVFLLGIPHFRLDITNGNEPAQSTNSFPVLKKIECLGALKRKFIKLPK